MSRVTSALCILLTAVCLRSSGEEPLARNVSHSMLPPRLVSAVPSSISNAQWDRRADLPHSAEVEAFALSNVRVMPGANLILCPVDRVVLRVGAGFHEAGQAPRAMVAAIVLSSDDGTVVGVILPPPKTPEVEYTLKSIEPWRNGTFVVTLSRLTTDGPNPAENVLLSSRASDTVWEVDIKQWSVSSLGRAIPVGTLVRALAASDIDVAWNVTDNTEWDGEVTIHSITGPSRRFECANTRDRARQEVGKLVAAGVPKSEIAEWGRGPDGGYWNSQQFVPAGKHGDVIAINRFAPKASGISIQPMNFAGAISRGIRLDHAAIARQVGASISDVALVDGVHSPDLMVPLAVSTRDGARSVWFFDTNDRVFIWRAPLRGQTEEGFADYNVDSLCSSPNGRLVAIQVMPLRVEEPGEVWICDGSERRVVARHRVNAVIGFGIAGVRDDGSCFIDTGREVRKVPLSGSCSALFRLP